RGYALCRRPNRSFFMFCRNTSVVRLANRVKTTEYGQCLAIMRSNRVHLLIAEKDSGGGNVLNLPESLDERARRRLQPAAVRTVVLNSPAMIERDDILLTSREVAFLLDLSPDTVNEFARRNVLPAFKKGRQWSFRKRDIAAFKRQ